MDEVPKSVEEMYLQGLKAEMEIIEHSVLHGALTLDLYKWHTGQLCGLRMAQAHFQKLIDEWKDQ